MGEVSPGQRPPRWARGPGGGDLVGGRRRQPWQRGSETGPAWAQRREKNPISLLGKESPHRPQASKGTCLNIKRLRICSRYGTWGVTFHFRKSNLPPPPRHLGQKCPKNNGRWNLAKREFRRLRHQVGHLRPFPPNPPPKREGLEREKKQSVTLSRTHLKQWCAMGSLV